MSLESVREKLLIPFFIFLYLHYIYIYSLGNHITYDGLVLKLMYENKYGRGYKSEPSDFSLGMLKSYMFLSCEETNKNVKQEQRQQTFLRLTGHFN